MTQYHTKAPSEAAKNLAHQIASRHGCVADIHDFSGIQSALDAHFIGEWPVIANAIADAIGCPDDFTLLQWCEELKSCAGGSVLSALDRLALLDAQAGEPSADQGKAIAEAFLELGDPSMYKSVLRKLVAKVTKPDESRELCVRLTQERDEARKERDDFQAELQKVCDHDWTHIDDSFDHEFGTEQVHSNFCEKCGATKPYEPETFGDEQI